MLLETPPHPAALPPPATPAGQAPQHRRFVQTLKQVLAWGARHWETGLLSLATLCTVAMVGYITLPAAPPPGPVLLSWQQPLRPEEASQMRASGDATAQALLATQMPIWQTTRRVLVEPLSAAPTAAIVQGGNKPHVTAAVPDWRVQPMATPADTLALAEKSPAPPARKRPPREKLKPQVVFLNRATIAQLDTLPGVGPKIALRILAYRKTLGGHFSSIQQLLDVPGIGPKTLDKMQPFLRL